MILLENTRQRESADAQNDPGAISYAAPEAANAVGRFLPDGAEGRCREQGFDSYAAELFPVGIRCRCVHRLLKKLGSEERAVPELTGSADIQPNKRVSLQHSGGRLSSSECCENIQLQTTAKSIVNRSVVTRTSTSSKSSIKRSVYYASKCRSRKVAGASAAHCK